eukprot:TRINITY_DN11634_c0_g1_i1.p1 TRINITY_DN11634_c0_g1~~TRINITY_DN11634_c0_g1_i1.p1  ORF type:complete len:612 (+),score=88.72 TRINITY_DN11634_c0_g1_i1:47-1882(+)
MMVMKIVVCCLVLLGLSCVITGEIVFSPCDVFTLSEAQTYLSHIFSNSQKRDDGSYVIHKGQVNDWIRSVRKFQPNGTFAPLETDVDIIAPLDSIVSSCATIQVPLDYDSPEGTTIDYFIHKYSALSGNPTNSLWLVQGGPGMSGIELEFLVPNLMTIMPDTDFYLPDPRGTGRSSRVTCSHENDDLSFGLEHLPDCVQEIKDKYVDISNFRTTHVAKDLHHAIEQLETSLPYSFYGLSYGTFVLNRFMHLFPTEGVNIIFDGVCSPHKCKIHKQSERYGNALKNLLVECGKGEQCSNLLSRDPVSNFVRVLKKQTLCNTEIDLISLIPSEIDYNFYPLVFPLIYRVDRCSYYDLAAIDAIFSAVADKLRKDEIFNAFVLDTYSVSKPEWSGSLLLNELVSFSELFDTEWSVSLEEELMDVSFFPYGSYQTIERGTHYLPYIYSDPLTDQFAPSSTAHVLLLNGKIDTATPDTWATYYYDNSPLNRMSMVLFENSGHGLLYPLGNPTSNSTHTCAAQITADFISGKVTIPTNHPCISKITPYSVEPDDSRVLLTSLGIVFDPYNGGVFDAILISFLAILNISLIFVFCCLGICSYCCFCRPKSEGISFEQE